MRIEPRIKKLEDQAQQEFPPEIRVVVCFVPPCPGKLGPCEHIVAAQIDGTGTVFHRLPEETIDALTERATASETGQMIHVSYVTTHGDLDDAAWNALAARSERGLK
jgi:hypothetical protein